MRRMDENKRHWIRKWKEESEREGVTERRGGGAAVEEIGEGRESSDLIVREVMSGAREWREGSGKWRRGRREQLRLRRSEDPRHRDLVMDSGRLKEWRFERSESESGVSRACGANAMNGEDLVGGAPELLF